MVAAGAGSRWSETRRGMLSRGRPAAAKWGVAERYQMQLHFNLNDLIFLYQFSGVSPGCSLLKATAP